MVRTLKRLLVGSTVSLALLGGVLIAPDGADAYTRTLVSKDGKVVFHCHYDDRTDKLAYCDVIYFPDAKSAKK